MMPYAWSAPGFLAGDWLLRMAKATNFRSQRIRARAVRLMGLLEAVFPGVVRDETRPAWWGCLCETIRWRPNARDDVILRSVLGLSSAWRGCPRCLSR